MLELLERTCPNCHGVNPESDQCDTCGHYLVVPDPRPPYIPYGTVGDPVSKVWVASLAAAQGLQHPACLLEPVRQAQTPLQRALLDPGLDGSLRTSIESAVGCLQDIQSFVHNRRVADLNQAWVGLVPAMEDMRSTLESLGLDVGRAASLRQAWYGEDCVDPFSDPDE